MRISYKWLKEFINIEISFEEFCTRLTMFGLEVESTTYIEEMYDNIVVGYIKSIKEHPNSSHLSICKVETGKNQPLQIVCGAPNVKKNQYVPVAKVNAKLRDSIVSIIKLKGIESYGVICSEKELGLSEDHSGVMLLSNKFKVGTPIAKVLELGDKIFEVEVTPNRPDLLGIIGVARETGIMLNTKYFLPKIEFQEVPSRTSDVIKVEIEDPILCPRYCCRVIKDVKITSSPKWMQKKLISAGLRPINNIVDITNYVLIEEGHPLHAFDLGNISGKKIIVRRAEKNEKITLLDEKTYSLNKDNLLIADEEKPLALAGIMGGAYSSINNKTKDIVIECACFNAKNIRKTSELYNLESESSYRFERGMDANRLIKVLDRTVQLIKETTGGKILTGIVDNYPSKKLPKEIFLRTERINKILNTKLKPDRIKEYLERFEFSLRRDKNNFYVTAPTYRPDLVREIDLIEEIARLYGYNNIQSNYRAFRITKKNKRKFLGRIKNYLVNIGFYEVCNLSFANPNDLNILKIPAHDYRRNSVELKNPLGEEFSILRTTLIPDLLKNTSLNLSHSFSNFKIFELNRIYIEEKNNSFSEPNFLTGIIAGNFFPHYWKEDPQKSDFFDVKGIIQSLFKLLKCYSKISFVQSHETYYDKIQAADIISTKDKLGSLGKVRDDILLKYDIEIPIFLFDINISKVLKMLTKVKYRYKEIIKYPPVIRDIALVAPDNIPVIEIKDFIKSIKPDVIKSINLFDVFKGFGIKNGYRSLAFRIEFQSVKSTLTDKYVDKLFDNIVKKLSSDKKIELRR